MFNHHKVEIEWGGRPLILETGKIARQADGAVLATYGETVVLATVVSAKEPKPGLDFFPLTVNYQEKTYAAGKIPGGYFKREGRPSENETLVSRLIDRPIRPLFADGYKNDTQVVVTVMQHDLENDPDVVAMVAASRRADAFGRSLHGPDRRRPRRLHQRRIRAQPACRRDAGIEARPRRRRHRRRRADGRIGSQGARRRRPCSAPSCSATRASSRSSTRSSSSPKWPPRSRATSPRRSYGELEAEMLTIAEADLRAAYKITDKQARYAAVDAAKAKVKAAFRRRRARRRRMVVRAGRDRVQGPAGQDRPLEHPRHRRAASTAAT